MKLIDAPSGQFVKHLHRRGLVGLATPWANMEKALAQVGVDNLNPAAVRTFLDLPDGGATEVKSYNDAVMTEYFGEYSSTAKSFLISGGCSEAFKEFAGFCTQWMLLQSNPTAVTKVRDSLIIASWENRHLDWATITSTTLVREATANRRHWATALAYWLGMFYTPPPGKERPSNRQKETAAQPAPEQDKDGRQQAPANRQAPAAATTDQVRDPAKGKGLEEVPPMEKEKEKEKKKKRPPAEEFELWEIGPSGPALDSLAKEEPGRPKKRWLRRPASREDGTTTIAVDRFPAKGPRRGRRYQERGERNRRPRHDHHHHLRQRRW
jgi:hypothetical protein